MKSGRAITEVARRFRNRSLGNGRIFGISRRTLQNIWYDFRRRGEAAFVLRYVAGKQHQIDPLLLQLVVQSAFLQSRSISEILVNAGINARNEWPSLRTIYRALPSKEIKHFLRAEQQLHAQRKATEKKLIAINGRLRELRGAAEEKFLIKGARS